jgi:hypothetical protein
MTSVNYLIKEISAVLGVLKTEPMQDLLLVDAITKAKLLHKQEIIDAWDNGNRYEYQKQINAFFMRTPEQYYQETFDSKGNATSDFDKPFMDFAKQYFKPKK